MNDMLLQAAPWFLSVITVGMMWMVGNKHRLSWYAGLCVQACWCGWSVWSNNYGFVPMTIALSVTYVRNQIKWSQDDAAESTLPAVQQSTGSSQGAGTTSSSDSYRRVLLSRQEGLRGCAQDGH